MARRLKEGFTTGTAAAAAAKAAAIALLDGEVPRWVEVDLPAGFTLGIRIEEAGAYSGEGRAAVVKDGGDDPDATHLATIRARVEAGEEPGVKVLGGVGVGTVTLPGLPVEVGRPAINPAPMAQIERAVCQVLERHQEVRGLAVTIEVDRGEKIARRTMNPRLGIVGGISILGTRGTVKPFSHESWTASVAQAMDVARAAGFSEIGLTTGGRTERLLGEALPKLKERGIVQAADFFAFAMRTAAEKGFSRLYWGVFFGKLVKQAQGLEYTHAKAAPLDVDLLAKWCREAGIAPRAAGEVAAANTARQALDVILADSAGWKVVQNVAWRARDAATAFAEGRVAVGYRVFDFNGRLLAAVT